jgi:hypothetical protein
MIIADKYKPEKYMKVVKGMCELQDLDVIIGVADGFQNSGTTVSGVIKKKTRKADLYIATFVNDDSDSTWLVEERAFAISKNNRMLIFVEEGTLLKISVYLQNLLRLHIEKTTVLSTASCDDGQGARSLGWAGIQDARRQRVDPAFRPTAGRMTVLTTLLTNHHRVVIFNTL